MAIGFFPRTVDSLKGFPSLVWAAKSGAGWPTLAAPMASRLIPFA